MQGNHLDDFPHISITIPREWVSPATVTWMLTAAADILNLKVWTKENSLWCLCGCLAVSIWLPCGALWFPCGSFAVSLWIPCGF